MALKPSRSYRDLSYTFKINPLRKDLNILKDENAIKRSLLNIFSYRKGEKFFNSSFGSGIPDLLFEPFDFATAGTLKNEVSLLISQYEPRVNLLEVIVDLNEAEYTYDVEIVYTIPDTSPQLFRTTLSLTSSSKI
nr:base plate wedge subunit [uncultured Mediterranean phage uvMED]BAR31140.1 base plate wedge subunit [uncultured Mediterranean phage uvMED]BAR31149.1 base plate wedge subunit [uncultured Mediterranean phage uvMED]BAR31168.1 base plate wedge subunit [uncultured Mediterranean phage uvMED]|tara:strand:+ start:158 stop:562 length:405 start_codon:yes stop_codon:yes gene_type:complete